MELLSGWVTNIIVFVLLATVIDMLLPSSAMQKYAKMVIGLLLIAIIISPIFSLFNTDFDTLMATATASFEKDGQKNLENLTEMKKKEIQASQHAYILEQTAGQLKAEVEEELIEKYDTEIQSIELAVENAEQPKIPEDLQKIVLTLDKAKRETDSVEAVAKIEINTGHAPQKQTANLEEIKKFLAAKWSVNEQLIEIAGEGDGEIEK
ncbi:stage III sporulation protein AF [Peribacillus cavernae]|uniref:Stage III sporulation protein AF n=1 Tax=Peribacillus cavernae TaxID=1674310 RepID=A0A433H8U1_9BACI|nr:stage III sporulation protein AF [Peribacillus cavernae]MDQ0220807.1 stage III sporulation protein AF [Peribacillus cavernae]RUQ24767.1 stage III sporulation protein AF [Peribacillus cavernae]